MPAGHDGYGSVKRARVPPSACTPSAPPPHAALAVYAALLDARLPRLHLVAGETPADVEVEVDDDPLASVPFPGAEGIPVCVTFLQVSAAEECGSDARGLPVGFNAFSLPRLAITASSMRGGKRRRVRMRASA
jgi:hypothetical protein